MASRLSSVLLFLLPFLFLSCTTWDKSKLDQKEIKDNKEFEEVVKIVPIEPPPEQKKVEDEKKDSKSQVKKGVEEKKPPKKHVKKDPPAEVKKPAPKKPEPKKPVKVVKKAGPRQPPLEDSEGFSGNRRPDVIPYRVGEEIVLGISFFAVEAGKFTMKVLPMVEVNGKKSYHFRYLIKTSPLFNMVYRVDDVAETFVDYESLLPHSYEIHVNESKQIRETKTFFDHKRLLATMWDNKKKKGTEIEKKKIAWEIKKWSQNVFSAAYYLRNFTLKVGKELKIRVGHEGKNIVMTGKVLRKETLYTDAGKFETFVVQPNFNVDGKFKPTGENYLWLTADDRKFIVRLESKIKIGSIVGEVQRIKK